MPVADKLWGDYGLVAAVANERGVPFRSREGQEEYASRLRCALDRQGTQEVGILPLEAATGTGKTLAYMVTGGLHAVGTGSKMLVSTHTVALGLQIMRHDGPLAAAVIGTATGTTPRIAHMRGRSHFASASRARAVALGLREANATKAAAAYVHLAERTERLARLAAQAIADGDLSDAASRIVGDALIDAIEAETETRFARADVCLLESSPEQDRRIHQLSRLLAGDAEILVTTHAYTARALANRALFDSYDEPYGLLVVDEADRWADSAASVSLAALSLDEAATAVDATLAALTDEDRMAPALEMAEKARSAIATLRAMAPSGRDETTPVEDAEPALAAIRLYMRAAGALASIAGEQRSRTASAVDRLKERVTAAARIVMALEAEGNFWIPRWRTSRIEGTASIAVHGRMPGRIMKRIWQTHGNNKPLARTVLLTSATLATPGFSEGTRWNNIRIATGVDAASGMLLADLSARIEPDRFGTLDARFADPAAPVPHGDAEGRLQPAAAAYAAQVVQAAMASSAERDGRTLVLTPSYADVEAIAALVPGIRQHRKGESLAAVLDEYRNTPGCCLITAGAWVGADLPGLVQDLVITRIPFPPRQDGEGYGGAVASALSKLAQGIGRAIRRPEDHATLWLCDPRVPHPDVVTEETGRLPHPAARAFTLDAIPERFRRDFDRRPGAAALGPHAIVEKRPTKGAKGPRKGKASGGRK